MKRFVLLLTTLVALFISFDAAAQTKAKTEEAIPFQLVEYKPSFQGGDANTFTKWVMDHLEYPDEAAQKGIQGRVTLQFTITSSGKITNVKVLRGLHPLLDEEAVRVVSLSPNWVPGRQGDKPVAVTYTYPVQFAIR